MNTCETQSPSPPNMPESRLIREHCSVICTDCKSSKPRKWILVGPRKCIKCGDTDKNHEAKI